MKFRFNEDSEEFSSLELTTGHNGPDKRESRARKNFKNKATQWTNDVLSTLKRMHRLTDRTNYAGEESEFKQIISAIKKEVKSLDTTFKNGKPVGFSLKEGYNMKIKKNGKVIKLNESDIKRIVKRVLTEDKKEPTEYTVSGQNKDTRGVGDSPKSMAQGYSVAFRKNEEIVKSLITYLSYEMGKAEQYGTERDLKKMGRAMEKAYDDAIHNMRKESLLRLIDHLNRMADDINSDYSIGKRIKWLIGLGRDTRDFQSAKDILKLVSDSIKYGAKEIGNFTKGNFDLDEQWISDMDYHNTKLKDVISQLVKLEIHDNKGVTHKTNPK